MKPFLAVFSNTQVQMNYFFFRALNTHLTPIFYGTSYTTLLLDGHKSSLQLQNVCSFKVSFMISNSPTLSPLLIAW